VEEVYLPFLLVRPSFAYRSVGVVPVAWAAEVDSSSYRRVEWEVEQDSEVDPEIAVEQIEEVEEASLRNLALC
jgi:hypothetical protein